MTPIGLTTTLQHDTSSGDGSYNDHSDLDGSGPAATSTIHMMDTTRARKRRRIEPPEGGSYILRKVLDEIPLQSDDHEGLVSISCVEFWSR